MSEWSGRPVKKISAKKLIYTESTYRKAFSQVLIDFENRCGYSLLHIEAMAKLEMEIDHFNSKLRSSSKRNHYKNLVVAYRPCNNKKREHWPTRKQIREGVHFLNPRVDVDYGVHLFEDPQTRKIFGVTDAGRWHVEKLNLNDEFLVAARKDRAAWRDIYGPRKPGEYIIVLPTGPMDKAQQAYYELKKKYLISIPDLPEQQMPEKDLDDIERELLGS